MVRRLTAIGSLFVQLDRRSPTFLQQQICEGLRQAITKGVLAPEARLPSTRELARELNVSRNTIVAALLQLVEEGYLVSRERSGTFVSRELPSASMAAVAPAAPRKQSSRLRTSQRLEALAQGANTFHNLRPRPRAFRLSRPALDQFPVREWNQILSRRAARITTGQLDYDQESPQLRAAIAELVSSSRGMRVHADQVLLFTGSQRALEFAAMAVLEPGDRAWMEEPGYPGARQVLVSAGATLSQVPVDAEGLDVEAGISTAPDARLVYATPSNQFPLGTAMSLARRHRLLAWAAEAEAWLVEDDYDCEFRYAGEPLPALHALDATGRVLYVNSFSRTMFPAIRLGYLIAPEALVDTFRAARATMEEQLPSLTQLALTDFIVEGHFVRHLRRMRQVYRKRAEALSSAAAVAGSKRLRLRPIGAGLHAVADLAPGLDAETVSAAAARRGIEAMPLSAFHARGGRGPQALVLGFGAVDPELARSEMAKLAEAIDEVSRSRR